MLAYAAGRRTIGSRQSNPSALLVIISVHVALLAIVMSARRLKRALSESGDEDLPEVASEGIAEPRVDPRLTPRAFHLSEPYPVTLALLQYFYSLALITPLQHTPVVLSQLLILATTYSIAHLETLVKHAMHKSLSNSTSVGVYEIATLCSSRSLQIRYVFH